jgi:hypothetical protein
MAIDDLRERIAFLNRGQGWVAAPCAVDSAPAVITPRPPLR